jgi:hypothetical protein
VAHQTDTTPQTDRTRLTDQQIDEYEALINAASPSPWRRWRTGTPAEIVDPDDTSTGRIWTGPDADFIIASRSMAPQLVRQVKDLRGLVRDFLDPDPCSFDHHGYCQTHGYLGGESASCPHGRARKMLAALENKEPTT